MKHYQSRFLAFLLTCCLVGTTVSARSTVFAEETLSGFTASQNLTYQNNVRFSDGVLKLSGYEITISGDLYLTGGTIALGGGMLHVKGNLIQSDGMMDVGGGVLIVDGGYRIEGEQPGENSSGCLDINQADTVHVGRDFIMRTTGSNVLLKYSLAKSAEFTIGGNLYVYADGDCTGFCPNAKICVNFSGSQEHEIYFDNDESYLSNIAVSRGGTLHFKNGNNITSDSSIAEVSGTSVKAVAEGTGNLVFNHSLNAVLTVGKQELPGDPDPIKQDILGDVNQDGKINIFDLMLCRKYLHDTAALSEQAVLNADVNQNGSPDTDDLKQIQSFLHGRITAFQEYPEISALIDRSEMTFYDEDYLIYFALESVSPNPEFSLKAYITFAQAEHTYQGTSSMYLAEINLSELPAGQGVNWKLPVLPYGGYEIRLYNETTKTELDFAGFFVNSEIGGGIETENYAIRLHVGSEEFLALWDKEILLRMETEGSVPENAVVLICPEDTPEQIDF